MPQNLRITVPRLGRNRHGVFFVRAPSFIDEDGRRRVVQQSLRTKDPSTAKLLALEYCLQISRGDSLSNDHRHGISPWTINVNSGQFSAEGDDDHKRLMEFVAKNAQLLELIARARAMAPSAPAFTAAAISPPLPPMDLGRAISELVPLHLQKEASVVKSKQTVHEKKMLLDDFMEVFGADTGIRAITAAEITTRWIPAELSRPNKKYQGKTLSRARLEKRRGYLAKFFTWAKASTFYTGENPMMVKMATKKEIRAQTKSYAEFTTDDLSKLFKADYTVNMDKPDWYWPPLLALFSGARLGEVCQLQIAAIYEIEGVKVFEILDGKTPESERVVPIHSTLLELGFWEYVEELRTNGETFLFPDRTSRTAVTKSAGRMWGVWISKCGIADKRKVFHSFRSTTISDLHNTDARVGAIRKAVGHTSTDIQGVHGHYVRGTLLVKLKEAIESLTYPLIKFEELRLSEPSFKAFFDGENAKKNSPGMLESARKKAAHLAAKAARLSVRPPKALKVAPSV